MTQYEQLDNIREKLIDQNNESQIREMKEKTLFFLMSQRNYDLNGNLKSSISVPKYQVHREYLDEILEKLGYAPKYEEEYDREIGGIYYIITL